METTTWGSQGEEHMTQDEIIPLNIEDEYVRNYLWERALIAIDDPCTRSHPHENMNEYCQHKTKIEAKLKEKNHGN